jgi:flagellar basal-body rod protein FlgB
MIGKLDEALSFHATALRLRAERQQVLAANIANADTPGYKAVDFDFRRALEAAAGGASRASGPAWAASAIPAAPASGAAPRLAATAPGHVLPSTGGMGGVWQLGYRNPSQAALDNNSVELDAERGRFADNALRYEASLRFLNGQIRSLMSAING